MVWSEEGLGGDVSHDFVAGIIGAKNETARLASLEEDPLGYRVARQLRDALRPSWSGKFWFLNVQKRAYNYSNKFQTSKWNMKVTKVRIWWLLSRRCAKFLPSEWYDKIIYNLCKNHLMPPLIFMLSADPYRVQRPTLSCLCPVGWRSSHSKTS